MKTCSKCHLEKELTAFPKRKERASGYCGYCKACRNDAQRNKTLQCPGRRSGEYRERMARLSQDPDKLAQHKTRSAEYTKAWKARMLNELAQYRAKRTRSVRNRDLKKRGVPGSHTQQEWADLCAYVCHGCANCGKTGPLERDHIIPITWPGTSNNIDNIQPLCEFCNCSKGNRHATNYLSEVYHGQPQV